MEDKSGKSKSGKFGSLLASLAIAGLLGGCAGSLPFQGSATSDESAAQTASAPSQPKSKAKRARATTAKDILAEWGTFGLAHPPYRRARAPGPRRAVESASLFDDNPDDSLTIDEIMANATCRSCDKKPYHRIVEQASNRHGVPASLIHAVIQKESGYNPAATSRKRARGLMQITPQTGRFLGVANSKQLYDPHTNINAGAAYLKYLMQNHDTVEEVLAAYNAGPGNVRKYNGVPPFSETRRYVIDVKRFYSATSSQ